MNYRQSQQRNNTGPTSDCGRQFSHDVVKFSNNVEEVIARLFCKEEQLQQRPDIQALQEAPFNQLLDEYSLHEKFMTEVCEYCHTIMRCKEEGQELRDGENDLNDEDRDEVSIQMDAMIVLYDKLKILTTDRLHSLQRIIEERQRSKIERLEKWISSMESKLAGADNIGPDFEAIQRQLREVEEIKNELEQKQEFLNLVSRLIVFDDVDLDSSQLRSRSYESLDRRLDTMNERWTKICHCVNERFERLRKASSIWRLLLTEGPQLSAWLGKIKRDLDELAEATRDTTDPAFIVKLIARSEKIEAEMKSKQSFYTSLESRVRMEIVGFDDPCSMLIIELEKRLEDMQDNWNSIMRQKRMIDFSLQASSYPDAIQNCSFKPVIPVPESITSNLNNNLNNGDIPTARPSDRTAADAESYNEPLTNSSSFGNDDDGSSPQLNGSLSDARAFDNSNSSQNTRSLVYGSSDRQQSNLPYTERDPTLSLNDDDSHDDEFGATLSSPQPNHTFIISAGDETDYSNFMRNTDHRVDMLVNNNDSESAMDKFLDSRVAGHGHSHDGAHNCRVEEWKHSLESFSSWLRQVEVALGVRTPTNDPIDIELSRGKRIWSELDLKSQLAFLQDIDNRIATTCQDEFDCLFLQGQQIIEDLMPEIGENEYEANLKEILADIEIRYGAVKRCLAERKRELADKEKWRKLLRNLRETANCLISQMEELIPETEIGVDLITLAQQQDQLMHSKEELENNASSNIFIEEAKQFLIIYDSLRQQYDQPTSKQTSKEFVDIWLSFSEFRDDVENHLERLTLHYSELSQTIEDRLERLNEVHKEMHALQHSIQDLAAKLQVAEILKSKWVPLDHLSIEELSEQLEDLKLYRERLIEVESTHKAMNSIVDWMDQMEVPLSQANLKRIDELNSIWDFIQESVVGRQKLIEHSFDEQSGSEQKFLAQTVADLPNWERRVATSKVPYFIDHQSNKTLWDHPKFTEILNSMDDCKCYVFSVYRTAMKLRLVQKRLGIDKLMLEQLKELLSMIDLLPPPSSSRPLGDLEHNNQDNLNTQSVQTKSAASNDGSLGIEQIISLLKIIYEKIQSAESPDLDVPVAIDLTLNWLLNLYDSTRTGRVNVLSLKVGLALICCATREQKYVYMFELVASPTTGAVDPKKLGALFEICMRMPIYLGEGESFGGPDLIESSIRNCFDMSKFNPQHPNCIDLVDYLNWLKTEPQVIIWLPVLHRLLISESTIHSVKCKLCGLDPIVGLRYRCLRCFKFNICQRCFLTGKHIYEHYEPAKHPFREYCAKTSSGESVRDFSKILRNKLHFGAGSSKA